MAMGSEEEAVSKELVWEFGLWSQAKQVSNSASAVSSHVT